MTCTLQEVDSVEILTLLDNTIDLVARDNSDVIQRAVPLEDGVIKNSIVAEHGFSALVTLTRDGQSRTLLFDFGFSEDGAARNAEALHADLSLVEVSVLSHGHLDHVGGIARLKGLTGKKRLDLILHPFAFVNPRFEKTPNDSKIFFPEFSRKNAELAGVNPIESEGPRSLLDGQSLFLGGIERVTDFEKGAPSLWCGSGDQEMPDPFYDDTGLAFLVRGKGLVVLTGCAHSGIVNTVRHARKATGIDEIYAVMGGFHLSGTDFERVVRPTTDFLKEIDPDYIVPTHCTGREAVMYIEKEMPGQFILNMSGTRLTFSS